MLRTWLETPLRALGRRLAHFLSKPLPQHPAQTPVAVADCLQPGDVLLVEGRSRISIAIRYITQSTWSHAALVVDVDTPDAQLIEADVELGVLCVPLSKYDGHNLRICRPMGLTPEDRRRVLAHAQARIGHRYDLKNVLDLLRYLLPEPPVPQRFRPRLIELGSGDPTRAICSTLLAQAFQAVNYPILPETETLTDPDTGARHTRYRQRHHSFYTPRDFDLSPYFAVVKPTLLRAGSYRELTLLPAAAPSAAAAKRDGSD